MKGANAAYRKASEFGPKDANYHYAIGHTLGEFGDKDGAADCYRRAIDINPRYFAAHINLGNLLRDKNLLGEAIVHFRKAIEINPKHPFGYNNLGKYLLEKKQWDEAVPCLRKLVEIDPKHRWAYQGLGQALKELGKLEEAIVAYRKDVDINPNSALSCSLLGLALRHMGRVDEAIVHLRKAVELKSKFSFPQDFLGEALRFKGNAEEAIVCFRKSKELGGNDRALEIASLLRGKGDLAGAIEELRADAKLAKMAVECQGRLGRALLLAGQFEDGLKELRRAKELGGGNARGDPLNVWLSWAEKAAELEGRWDAYLKGEYKPSDTPARLGLALVASARQDYLAAARLYADAFATSPKLTEEPLNQARFHAALCAVRAAAGEGKQTSKLDAKEQTHWRHQAREWLNADLALWSGLTPHQKHLVHLYGAVRQPWPACARRLLYPAFPYRNRKPGANYGPTWMPWP